MLDCLVVLSGGMDSTVLLTDCVHKYDTISAISFDYGSKHNDRELPLALAICEKLGVDHKIISLPFIGELFSSSLLASGDEVPDGAYDEPTMKSTVVPFRNGIMLSIAAGYAESIGAVKIVLGSHAGDHFIYPDCRPEFNETFAKVVNIGTDDKVNIEFPYATMDKRDIGDLGRRLKVDFCSTWTCYKGEDIHCGTCGACDERKYALRRDEGLDPTEYRV